MFCKTNFKTIYFSKNHSNIFLLSNFIGQLFWPKKHKITHCLDSKHRALYIPFQICGHFKLSDEKSSIKV